MRLQIILFIVCIFSYGCASVHQPIDVSRLEAARVSLAKVDVSSVATLTTAVALSKQVDTKQQDEDLSKAFADMLSGCKSALSDFEDKANNSKKWKIGIATTGALVGGVAVPALTTATAASNAVWIAGLGGLSGVANVAQQTMDSEGVTSSSMLAIRSQILNDWKSATNDYFDSNKNYQERKIAIQKGIVACTMYAITVTNADVTTGTSGGN
jgi:uncharacterized protein YceK